MNYLEIAGVLIGLLYLYLEYRASSWLWIAGVIMPAIYIFVYYDAGLYADMGISIYYILASVYGLIIWIKERDRSSLANPRSDNQERVGDTQNLQSEENKNRDAEGIKSLPGRYYLPIVVSIIILTAVIGFILERLTDSTVPWADGFTTAVSILAMWMLAKKYTQQWILWIIADLACSILYVYKELWFTGGLYLLYSIIAYFGYKRWQKISTR